MPRSPEGENFEMFALGSLEPFFVCARPRCTLSSSDVSGLYSSGAFVSWSVPMPGLRSRGVLSTVVPGFALGSLEPFFVCARSRYALAAHDARSRCARLLAFRLLRYFCNAPFAYCDILATCLSPPAIFWQRAFRLLRYFGDVPFASCDILATCLSPPAIFW